MKQCSKCHIEKPSSHFYVKDSSKGRLHAQCKDCYKLHRQTYAAQHYKKYGDAYRVRAKEYANKQRRSLQAKLLEYLSDKSCVLCGETDARTFELDHLDPSLKEFGIATAIRYRMKWEKIEAELTKCRVLCANCHKKETARQFNWYKQPL